MERCIYFQFTYKILNQDIKEDGIEDVEEQNRFCAGFSHVNIVFILKELLEKRNARNLGSHLV